jgi:hypothetical protein
MPEILHELYKAFPNQKYMASLQRLKQIPEAPQLNETP